MPIDDSVMKCDIGNVRDLTILPNNNNLVMCSNVTNFDDGCELPSLNDFAWTEKNGYLIEEESDSSEDHIINFSFGLTNSRSLWQKQLYGRIWTSFGGSNRDVVI